MYKQASRHSHNPKHTQVYVLREFNDTQTGMLLGIPRSARCVQRFDDSLNSAIHITYRISLRSSSMREPRDPLLKVVLLFFITFCTTMVHVCKENHRQPEQCQAAYKQCTSGKNEKNKQERDSVHMPLGASYNHLPLPEFYFNNDPSAGSPTETLLRLLLPLNEQV